MTFHMNQEIWTLLSFFFSILNFMIVGVPIGHDPRDVPKQLHPGVLHRLIPHVLLLQVGADRVQKYRSHHAEIVAGNPCVSVVLAQFEQVFLGLEIEK
jgi:hypothetical protein